MIGKLALTFMVIFVFVMALWLGVNKGTPEEEFKSLKEAVSWISFTSMVLTVLMIFILVIQCIWKIK